MSPNDVQWWSFVVGVGLFVAFVGGVLLRRRARERRHGPTPVPGEFVTERGPLEPTTQSTGAEPSARRRPPGNAPPTGEPFEVASTIRSAILRAVAQRAPLGWSALVLSPPPHPNRMTWHVHLAPEVALDLADGRTLKVAAPAASHEWQVAGGRTAAVGDGDPDPPPGKETVAVRVTGPYLLVALSREGERLLLAAQVVVTDGEEFPRPRALATDQRAVQGALREAIELTVGSRMSGTMPAVGYPLASWSGHERSWLTIGR